MQYRYSGDRVMNMAAIDIGTNSCRLLVSRVFINPQKRSYLKFNTSPITWKSIDSFCRIVKLGEGLTKTGVLDQAAIQRTLDALHICYKKICYYRVSHLRIVATEACRQAQNTADLVRAVRRAFNLSVDIITGPEEAELALLGCCEMLNWRKQYMLIFDIGGGSTEVIWARLKTDCRNTYLFQPFYEILDSVSLPYGVVTVNDNLIGYLSAEKIFSHVHEKVCQDLQTFVEKNQIHDLKDQAQMIGSSGTVTTFGALHLGLDSYDRRRIDGLKVPTEDMINLCRNLDSNKMDIVPPEFARREDLMNVGAAILLGIFETLQIPELTIADRGIREGIIVDLIRKHVVPHVSVQNRRAHSHGPV